MTVTLHDPPAAAAATGMGRAPGQEQAPRRRAAPTSRSYRDIVVANVFNRFNAMLGILLAVTLWVGPIQDAAFGLVLVANLGIGLVQEIRAKKALDRLRLVTAPRVRVLRGGVATEVAAEAVAAGDLVSISRGDQLVADGVLKESAGLELDESLLTGEAEPVARASGDGVRAGTFVVAGRGVYEAREVGDATYAGALAEEARRFKRAPSELRRGTNRLLRIIGWLMPVAALMLVISQFDAHATTVEAVRAAIAGMVTLVPEGLVLLTSIALASAVLRLATRGALAQELAAVEMLARADVVCMDKTGTLTEGRIGLAGLRPLDRPEDAEAALGAIARTEPSPDGVLSALAEAFAAPAGWRLETGVGFSSSRRWSAAGFAGHGTWVLGAPEVLAAAARTPAWDRAEAAAAREQSGGRRVLVLARSSARLGREGVLPAGLEPSALVLLEERVRPQAAAMIAYLRREGVTMKILSGDSELTARAVAERLGLDGSAVTGRASPDDKRRIIAGLQAAGHTVAMAGDGVNDVPALKQADVGIALASGSAATRAVAQFVLLHSDFDVLPAIVAEGRRVVANMERLGRLFVTKTSYAFVISLLVGLMGLPFPFLLRQLTLVAMFTVGIPSFFLALEPNLARARKGFAGRVARFAVPAGVVIAVAVLASFELAARLGGADLAQSRTVATLVLDGLSLWLLLMMSRPLTGLRSAVVAAAAAGAASALLIPGLREFFAIVPPERRAWLAVPAAVAGGVAALELVGRRFGIAGAPAAGPAA